MVNSYERLKEGKDLNSTCGKMKDLCLECADLSLFWMEICGLLEGSARIRNGIGGLLGIPRLGLTLAFEEGEFRILGGLCRGWSLRCIHGRR